MEPLSKKRKLAPKLSTSSAPSSHGGYYPHDSSSSQAQTQPHPSSQPPPQHILPPPPSQQHHYAVHEPSPPERHDFEAFARHLQDAAMLIQRQTERAPYQEVSVLLLRWEDDESVKDDLAALESVFQRSYGYHTRQWHIPASTNTSMKLGVQMASFLDTSRPNHLHIIYYAGHGYKGTDGHLYWTSNARADADKLKWDSVRSYFEDAQSDILLLLDTCFIPNHPMTGSHGMKQVIAAYSSDHRMDRHISDRSFTLNLADTLHRLSGGRPFTTQKLYEEAYALKQHQLAQVAGPPNGATSNHLTASQLPMLFTMAPGSVEHLRLAPMPRQAHPIPSPRSNESTDHNAIRGREDSIIDPESVADLRFDDPRVLVCTTFVGEASPDMSSFSQWLQNSPPLASNIAIEGMFLGPPTMLLISMPHGIWNVVQHDKVCCFLGYISSRNMLQHYQKLVRLSGIKPSAKEVEDGRILLEARELASSSPSRARREIDSSLSNDNAKGLAETNSSNAAYAAAALRGTPIKPKEEDSAEVKEAAEQLKALSHVRHRSDEGVSSALPPARRRTTLPDGSPKRRRSDLGPTRGIGEAGADESLGSIDISTSPSDRTKLPRQEMQCSHCSHAPFKDSSSLRKHIAAAHTRPFPCAFSFAGCTSTFGSKNEWKRHIASQHLCLQFYRCSQCPQSAVDGKANEFNRKDLFTQHLRRMHAPSQIKRSALAKGDNQSQAEWDSRVREMQQSCLMSRRKPPQKAACPKPGCHSKFEGSGAWDEWTEHVGRHMEKGEADRLTVDSLLAQWALDEGIIEPRGDGKYKFTSNNGADGRRPSSDQKDSTHTSFTETQVADEISVAAPIKATDNMEVDS